MKIPLLDLRREREALGAELDEACRDVLDGMRLLKGPQLAAFEAEIAAYTGSAHAVGVASGTDALLLSVQALGIGPGDEVVLQANGFIADAEAIRHSGARPIVVDVEKDGLGPDPAQVRDALSERTRALLVVHLHGSPLPLDPLIGICTARELALIEDGSHAHGAARQGRKVGTFGAVGCFSAGVVKNLGALGDAGFVTTDDGSLAQRIRLLGTHGQESKNRHVLYGFNSRLDELQAAVLRVKLRHLDARNERRRRIAAFYRESFADLDLVVAPEGPGEAHVYHQFVVRCARRDQLQEYLRAGGIETGIHYPVPLHRQPAWVSAYGESGPMPNAERQAREMLSLPVFPDLATEEMEHVAARVREFFGARP